MLGPVRARNGEWVSEFAMILDNCLEPLEADKILRSPFYDYSFTCLGKNTRD